MLSDMIFYATLTAHNSQASQKCSFTHHHTLPTSQPLFYREQQTRQKKELTCEILHPFVNNTVRYTPTTLEKYPFTSQV